MFETDTEKAQQIQSDVLLEKTSDNPNFIYNKLAAKNKSLDTSDKRIVGAINELLKKQNSLQSAVQNSINQSFDATGDIISDPSLLERLKAVSPNLIEAVCDHEEKINTLQELVEQLKKNGGNNNGSGNQTITIGGINWDFGEDDMGNLNALLNVTGKNIKDLDIHVLSEVSPECEARRLYKTVKSGETIDVCVGADLKALAPEKATNITFYNFDKEDNIKVYANYDNVDLDTSVPGERIIPCVPEMGYYSTNGMPYFKVNVKDIDGPQIIGIVYGKDGYQTPKTYHNGSSNTYSTSVTTQSEFYRINQDYSINECMIGQQIRLFQNFKELDTEIGKVVEIPTIWTKTEILEDGPFAGEICWWIADRPVDGFHVHPAFIKPDGTYGNLQISKYVMQHTKADVNTPLSVPGVINSSDYEVDRVIYSEKETKQQYFNEHGGFHLKNIYEQHLIAKLMLLEFGRNPKPTALEPYWHVLRDDGNYYETTTYRVIFHGIYDPISFRLVDSKGSVSILGTYIDGIETEEEDTTVYIMKADGSGELVNGGMTFPTGSVYFSTPAKIGNVNGINYDDLFIVDIAQANGTNGSGSSYHIFGGQSQNFGAVSKFAITSNTTYDGQGAMIIQSIVKTSTTGYPYRVCRVV